MSKDRVSRHGTADMILDASRGLLRLAEDPGLREHLAWCTRCRQKVSVWKTFAGVTPRLREAEPPEEAVVQAKALAVGPPRVTELTRMNAASRYDRMWVPPAASARGAPSDQAIYQADEFAVDLRVSRERAHVAIVGQITNVRRPARRLAHVRVTLLAGDRVVERAFSNDRGEFHVEHREHDRMWIEVVPQEGRLIRIPLRPKQMAS
jgi:hypothetical protein